MGRQSSSLRIIALMLAMAFLLAACPAAAPTGGEAMPVEEEMEEEVLTILYWQASSLPSAYLSGGTKDRDASAITLEPLAGFNPDGAMVPKLAVEIPTIENGGIAEDLMSITWTLKQGVKWSDGSDLTAEDVVFTWQYCTDEASGCTSSAAFLGIEAVEALDARTIKITFDYSGDIATGHLNESGQNVDEADQSIAHRARSDLSRPAGDEWLIDAAIMKAPFFARPIRTVIGRVDNQGIVFQVLRFQQLQTVPHGFIHLGDL